MTQNPSLGCTYLAQINVYSIDFQHVLSMRLEH